MLRLLAIFQSFQLFQRGVRWRTLEDILKKRFSSKSVFSTIEGATPSYDSLLELQNQEELEDGLQNPKIYYLDLYLGKVDHEGHATSNPAAMLKKFREVDQQADRFGPPSRKAHWPARRFPSLSPITA